MENIQCEVKPLCDLCGSVGVVVQSGIADPDGHLDGSWSFQRCNNEACGVYWLDPAPLPEEMWKAYATYHTHSKKSEGKFGKLMLSLAQRFIKLRFLPVWISNGLKREGDNIRLMMLADEPKGKLLDVGCGGGRFLQRMKKRGWVVEGIDFDEQATKKVTSKYGIKTYVGDLITCALPANTYDAITLSQAIEHLYNPKETLAECLRILKPGGLLVMTTPNVNSLAAKIYGASWRGWEAPRHLHLFSVVTVRRNTQQYGFAEVDASTYSAGAAIVYKVSDAIQHGRPPNWLAAVNALYLSYQQELHEYQAQKKQVHTGQNVLVQARKSSR